MKAFFAVIGGIALLFGFIFVANLFGWQMAAFFNPKMEQVRRNTFEQSQSYNDGMTRDLENIMLQYSKASDTEKAALRAVALHRFSVYPSEKLTPEMRTFYNNLKNGE